jgi:hypothetical protein
LHPGGRGFESRWLHPTLQRGAFAHRGPGANFTGCALFPPMGGKTDRSRSDVWRLARRQHGVVARRQLRDLGFTSKAIEHRIARGRLHPVAQGVYAIGRPQLTQHGRWMAAVLSCGPQAVLSHDDAAALLEIRATTSDAIEVSVPPSSVDPESLPTAAPRFAPGT